ncbi:MAG TPA: hypothetical protein ENL42_02725 [Thermoplasmatales archaeon]|nr:hypothetical protein [Thermoplasmatales archaeon]
MNRKLLGIIVVASILLTGCIKKEEEKVPSVFKTDAFKVGDKIEYETWGKMIVKREEGGFLIYGSRGTTTIEIQKANVEDGFGNSFAALEFHVTLDETPYNYTIEEKESLPIGMDKYVYRIYEEGKVGGIIKSVTIHHAINRERKIVINSHPILDIVDFFLQEEFSDNMNGSFYYQGINFGWSAKYDKNVKALRIDILANSSVNFSIWIRNGYPLPYQISFSSDNGIRHNKYTYILKKFKRGDGEEIYIGNINYSSKRETEFYEWKDFGVPPHGEGSKLKMSIREAMAQALTFSGLKKFLNEHKDAYMVYAEYWESGGEAGWLLHFANKEMRKDYVLNISNTGRAPIPSTELSPYLAYEEIPKDIDEVADKMLSVAEAENIFSSMHDFYNENYTFEIAFIEEYYPDTIFDVWEGNSKEKEISLSTISPRGACFINGLHEMVKDYSFGYRLVVESPPFIVFDGKIDGGNGLVTYVYEEY